MSSIPARAWVPVDDDGPVLILAPAFEGPIAVVVSEPSSFVPEQWGREPGSVRLDDRPTFDAAIDVAKYGATTLCWHDSGEIARMAVHLDEAGHHSPTLLVSTNLGAEMLESPIGAMTRIGPMTIERGEFLWWARCDLIDAASAVFTDEGEPLAGWANGDPLYELTTDGGGDVVFGHESILGSWGSMDGTFALFTQPVHATQFVRTYRGSVRKFITSPDDIEASYRLREVPDLRGRLSALPQVPPVSIVINPGGPRPSAAVVHRSLDDVAIETVRGTYTVEDMNRLRCTELKHRWDGHGTFRWKGDGALELSALSISTSPLPLPLLGAMGTELSAREVKALVAQFLNSTGADDSGAGQGGEPLSPTSVFVVAYTDVVLGLRSIWTFDSAESAMRALVTYDRDHDRPRRVGGAQVCEQLGFGGSGDAKAEGLSSEEFTSGVAQILEALIVNGYRPDRLDSLASLCNRVLRTIRIDAVGYAGDLALRLQGDPEQIEFLEVLTGFPFEAGELSEWLRQLAPEPDPVGVGQVRERLGPLTDQLEPAARLFVATAMLDRAARGGSPLLDFAPVVQSLSKALEVELVALLRAAGRHLVNELHDWPRGTDNDELLRNVILGIGRLPTLGDFPHLLKTVPSGIQRAFTDSIDALPSGRALRTDRFRGFLTKTAFSRNRAAHDTPIEMSKAEACLVDVLGDIGSPGRLAMVTAAKVAAISR